MTSTTREVAQCFMDHLAAGRAMAAFEMLAEDGQYTVIGTTPASRTYVNRDDFLTNIPRTLSGFTRAPMLKFQPPIVDGDRAVLLASGEGEGKFGPYKQPYYALVLRIRDGKLVDVVEFLDTCMLETAVFGKKLVDA